MRLSLISVGPPYRGGISDLSALIYQELSQSHTLQFINFSRQYPALLFPGKTEYKEGPQAVEIETTRAIDSINPLSWIRAAQRIKKFAPDAVIFRYWNPFFAPMINVISRSLSNQGIKVTLLVDNLIPHEESFIDSFMARRVLAHADHVFTMSKSVSQDVRRHHSQVAIRTLFHPLYEIYKSSFSKAEARQKLGLGSEPLLMYFGLIRPYKGLDILINALGLIKDDLPELSSLMLGEAYEDEQKYRDMIHENGLEDRVKFKNAFVSDEDLPIYFAASDVLVLPYRTATQSGIVGIAFQMDRPVIATNVGGLGEYIKEGHTGYLVPPENPEQLAQAISKFFSGDDSQKMSDAVKAEKSKYSIASFCQKVIEEISHE